ncbi:hypothetical protein VP01_6994g1, partial [Puccinia sorghi]
GSNSEESPLHQGLSNVTFGQSSKNSSPHKHHSQVTDKSKHPASQTPLSNQARNGGISCGEKAGMATQGARTQNGKAFEGPTNRMMWRIGERLYHKTVMRMLSLTSKIKRTHLIVWRWLKDITYRLMEKKKYMDVQNFGENTGAGIENKSGVQTLYNFLEPKCLCYHRLDVLFQEKANVTALFEFDHFKPGDELRLLMDSNFKHEDDGVGATVSDGEDDSEEAKLDNEANSSNQQETSATSRHLPAQDEVNNSLCPLLLGEEGKSHPATGDGPIGNQSAGDGPIGNDLSNQR